MSTPAWKKRARQEEHKKAKQKKQMDALFASVKKRKKEFVEYTPPVTVVRETKEYPSLSNVIPVGACPPPQQKVYTGTLVKGISTMHKSNAVPIISEEEARDHASMRR